MPRVSRQQTDLNRVAIEESSSRLFRERGLKSVSVADLMAEVGLTHGGFYGHFESKDALAAVACERSFANSEARWKERVAGKDGASALAAIVGSYLSTQSRNSPGTGCPTAGFIADVAREPAEAPIRAAYHEGVEKLLAVLASISHSGDEAADRREALVQFSTMVGALMLARATNGTPLSNEILAAAKKSLAAAPPRSLAEAR